PARLSLARLPTPLVHLPRTSAVLGVELYLKRDDLTGVELSGNKVRKLEFLLAEAQARGADTIVTCGGAQSNHCRAAALAAARLGLRAVLLLRTADPARPPAPVGNVLLDRLAGAEIVWVTAAEYARRDEIFEREAARLRAAGHAPYVIPEGGSNALGAWGYVAAAEELAADLAALPPAPTTIVYACGSGGTGAGLLIGARWLDFAQKGIRVAGFNVSDTSEHFVAAIHAITSAFDERHGTDARIARSDIEIIDGYVGAGYGKSEPGELALIRDMARREGILLDPVYSGRAFHGMWKEIERDRARFGERVVFVHTGGIFGLLAEGDELVREG
ncbi:MAG TPA: D-cysteine desulfhydrase family protein, partial [Haliangium sp.]|nr:D-cysteine desulfhydrase family protein [Haliangium sp.]